jgi:type IV pilus assembly protein PilM
MHCIGLQMEGPITKMAKARWIKKKIHIDLLRSFPLIENGSYVKPLYFSQSSEEPEYFIATGLEASDILLRDLHVKLLDKKKILSSLPFQIEGQIPYPAEDTIVSAQIHRQDESKSSKVVLYATKTQYLEQHLAQFKLIEADPEQISCTPAALYRYFQYFFPSMKNAFLLHFGAKHSAALCIVDGHLEVFHSFPIGMEMFSEALEKDETLRCSREDTIQKGGCLDFLSIDSHEYPHLAAVISQSQRELDRLLIFLQKKVAKEEIGDMVLTGNFSSFAKFKDFIRKALPSHFQIHSCPSSDLYDSTTLEAFAIPIGLALEGLINDNLSVQFRKQAYASSSSHKRKIKQFLSYALAIFVLTSATLLAGNMALEKKEKHLLDVFNSYFSGQMENKVQNLDQLELETRKIESSFKKDKTPYPLSLPVPNVSEVLAWLSSHPVLNPAYSEQETPDLIDLRHIKYTLVKHPKIGAASSPYQVKIELELETSNPQIARDFHQALLKDSSIADPKKEFSWQSKGNTHFASFFLKNKQAGRI